MLEVIHVHVDKPVPTSRCKPGPGSCQEAREPLQVLARVCIECTPTAPDVLQRRCQRCQAGCAGSRPATMANAFLESPASAAIARPKSGILVRLH